MFEISQHQVKANLKTDGEAVDDHEFLTGVGAGAVVNAEAERGNAHGHRDIAVRGGGARGAGKSRMLFADGDIVKLDDLDFRFMATPGHTKGCACIIVEDKIFTGDTLFSRGYGRTDLYGGSTRDMKMSLKKIGAIEGDYEIYPAHGPHSTLKTEKYANPYLRKAMGLGI